MRVASKTEYPENWRSIAKKIKDKKGWRCERCTHEHDPKHGYCLTVHHLDGNKSNNEDWNLAVLCQRCHLYMQPVVMAQMLFSFVSVSRWFEPHLEGYKKSRQETNEEAKATKDV